MSGSQNSPATASVSVKDELRDFYSTYEAASGKNLADYLFGVPEDRAGSQVFRFTCTFNKFINLGGEKILLDLSGFSQETPELLDRVIERINNLSSSDGNKLSSDKLELLRNFIINIDYYRVQAILIEFYMTKWIGVNFLEDCVKIVSNCDLSIDFDESGSISATYSLSDIKLNFLDGYSGNGFLLSAGNVPSLDVITSFSKGRASEFDEIIDSDKLIISCQEEDSTDVFCFNIEDIKL